jgi:sigma-B regulation protein RsbU (phosphoserine phosphatase)
MDFVKKMIGSTKDREEKAFLETYALLRVIFDQSTQLMGIMKPDGTVLKINPTALSFTKAQESDVIGKPFWETPWWAHSPEQQELLRESIKRAARGEFIHFEATHQTPDGDLVYVDFSIKPVKDERGSVVLLIPEGNNITARKLAEEALREAAVKYQIVADNTYNWEFWLSPDEKFIYISPSCLTVTGHRVEEFTANPNIILDLIHPDDRHLWADHRHLVTNAKIPEGLEFRIIRPDGSISWIHHLCMPVFDNNKNFIGTRGSFSDITKRKLAEERNLRLAAIVDSSDDAIIGKTMDGIITSWNKGAEKIFGYTESEVLGKSITMLIPAENIAEVLNIHERIQAGEHVEHFETIRRKKNGAMIVMSLTYSPVKDEQGRTVALSTIGRDISDRKKAEQVLMENALMNGELKIAQEIQQSLLPCCQVDLPGLLIACRFLPAAHVGGDYYDFLTLGNGIVDMVIADVTGHSVGSALLMTMVRSILHAKVSTSCSPGKLLTVLNNLLHNDLSRAELQLSMFYIRIDTVNRTLTYANAGHSQPLLMCARDGSFSELDAEGLLIGIKSAVDFEEKVIRVEAGDILTLYTDGVTESEDAAGNFFGTGRLSRAIAARSSGHPQEIVAGVFQELAAFTLSDDVALIIVKFLP